MDLFNNPVASALGLDRVRLASASLGYPERQLQRAIHVAGTNGKGSVCYKLAAGLQQLGYKVGLYTSPHISSFRERIQINGQMVDESWIRQMSRLLPADLSFFEAMTLLALRYFVDNDVDYAVIEVGLGGRLDATNIITPLLSIITSIDYDHTALLGPTLADIAQEKAGIIKEGVPYLLGPSAAAHIAGGAVSPPASSYDAENSALAAQAFPLLGLRIPHEALTSRPPCRLERVQDVILDVAHNPAGLTRLFEALPPAPYHAIVGMSADKDINSSLAILAAHVHSIHFVKADNPRAAEPALLRSLWPSSKPAYIYPSIEEALSAAPAPTLVTGSFFLMAAARCALGIVEPSDEYLFQEILPSTKLFSPRDVSSVG